MGNLVISIVKNELNVPNTMILNLTIKNINLKILKKTPKMLPEFVTQSKRQEVVQNRIKILQILHCNYNEELNVPNTKS